MLWFCCWMIALWSDEQEAEITTDRMKPHACTCNFWGPSATRARLSGQLPPLPKKPDDDKVAHLGPERSSGGRYRLTARRRQDLARDRSSQPFHRQGVG
jgi:hypothetical protein